jgi:hypothetical protein
MTSTADANRVILTGENPFIRLSETDDGPLTTDASFWRILLSPAGPGHVLYLNSEQTDGQWRIYSDNIAMARWLQSTVQGMLNAATRDLKIPVIEAEFDKQGRECSRLRLSPRRQECRSLVPVRRVSSH